MRPLSRTLLLALLMASTSAVVGQEVRFGEGGVRQGRIDPRDLQEGTTEVAGQGLSVPGMDLDDAGDPRHWIGDDPAFALRAFVDSAWHTAETSQDSVVPGIGVHWVRYHLYPNARLKGVPLMLNVRSTSGFEVFLNGRSLLYAAPMPSLEDAEVVRLSDTVPQLSIPLTFACDGRPEVLALRIQADPGSSLRAASMHMTLHAMDTSYSMQRSMLHYGVFVGINAIILLLALLIWSFERSDRSWLLLALLSLVSVVEIVCELGGEQGVLGLSDGTMRMMERTAVVLLPLPMYLLIMVLGTMRGDLSRKRVQRYTVGVLVLTLIGIAYGFGESSGILDTTTGLATTLDSPAVIVTLLVLLLLFAVIFTWFTIDVVRLGVRLLRSTGYVRWVGAGALASSLLSLALRITSGLAGSGLSSWLAVLANYCSYVAVPLSVAVYLAIRSAHHNRLVARQRDDLDREVKDRTAQLSAEKERSDALLLNILPHEVAQELKDTGAAAARHFDQATVLFTDFRGFTRLSEQVTPAELVQELNACFKAFDGITSARGIEKIKTIGDAYMATGGLPDPAHGSPADVVRAALDMQAFMRQHKAERIALGKPFFDMRVGIHTGPVIAGIVGVKKFQYDIWGDTVNTASRMESSGEVGKVNISERTHALVKDEPGLTFTARGKVQAKGKGEMEMYFVDPA